MIKYFLPLFFFGSSVTELIAQDNCKPGSVTIVEFYNRVREITIDGKNELPVICKKYSGFDFKNFKPIEGKIGADYFEVGYGQDGGIVEVAHFEQEKRLFNFRLLIHDFENFRIALLKLPYTDGKFWFKPVAFLFMKTGGENYMVNILPQFGDRGVFHDGLYYESFPSSNTESISCIMELDQDLYPVRSLRFSNLQLVMDSNFLYESKEKHILKYEVANFYTTQTGNKKLMLNINDCFLQLFVNISNVKPDIGIKVHPNTHGYSSAPLWIFSGAHDYE